MINSIFSFESTRIRQRSAPLLEEREKFLAHLHDIGIPLQQLRSTASTLIHIVRLMDLSELRQIQPAEVHDAAVLWCKAEYKVRGKYAKSPAYFTMVAMRWFRFASVISPMMTVKTEIEAKLEDFRNYMTLELGYSQFTIRCQAGRAGKFLAWAKSKKPNFGDIDLGDVEEYVARCRSRGLKPRTMNSICCALRTFFRWAAARGLNSPKIAPGIKYDRIYRFQTKPRGPEWRDVRRLLNVGFGTAPHELRASAIMSLCAVYALRRCEVTRLKLSDIDWMSETITVRRAKSGKIQQFPLQFEVGEKIVDYLRGGRAKCACRNIFVTTKPPYKPMDPATTWKMISTRLKQQKIQSESFGLHALRHSCATKLLSDGSTLKEVAEFLGHSDMSSVSIYAKFDFKTLTQVATFSLAGVL